MASYGVGQGVTWLCARSITTKGTAAAATMVKGTRQDSICMRWQSIGKSADLPMLTGNLPTHTAEYIVEWTRGSQ